MKLFVLKALVYTLLTYSQVTLADDLYHCGNSYQDTPCKNAVNTKSTSKKTAQIVNNSTANEKLSSLTVSTDCKKRGEIAKEIAKFRHAGKTEDQQLKATTDIASQALIKNVYSRRGSSLQVQYVIEHECMQLIEKDRLTKKQMAESARLSNGSIVSSNSRPNNPIKISPKVATTPSLPTLPRTSALDEPTIQPVPSAPIAQTIKVKENQHDEGDELGICRAFKAGLENIASQKRKGGDAAYMKDLKQQQNQLTHEMKSAGC
jgi:hypothetical protein